VPAAVKQARLAEVIATFHRVAAAKHAERVGTRVWVLVEGSARRAPEQDLGGRCDANLRVFFPALAVPAVEGGPDRVPAKGEYVLVHVEHATSASLRGRAIAVARLRTAALAAPTRLADSATG
jgi:tRNA A37 methylthiotransferase MiaB